jgi:hypothetical protein
MEQGKVSEVPEEMIIPWLLQALKTTEMGISIRFKSASTIKTYMKRGTIDQIKEKKTRQLNFISKLF